jgi:phosphomannomutase
MKFGTSGLRGLVEDMTDEACAAWTGAFLAHLAGDGSPPPTVLLGRDLRPSSPRISAACAGAIRAAGGLAIDCGVLPTPALALEAARRDVPAVMVTGSHIPFDRNGLKFFRSGGEIDKADEAGILAAHAAGVRPRADGPGGDAADDGARARYVDRGRGFFAPGALAGRRIGVWQHSAAGRDVVAEALAGFGAEVIALGRSDVFVPIDTEALSREDAGRVRAWVGEHALDALVSTDGDGDRPLIADETGAFLRGDLLGLLTARILGADAIATPISSTTAIERSGWAARVERCRIGSPYVIEAMARLTAEGARLCVGFEANGGFLLGARVARQGGALEPLPTRDAILPMLALLTEAAGRGAPLSALVAEAPQRATASDRLSPAPPERSGPLLAGLAADPQARGALLAAIGAGPAVSVDLLDGVRIALGDDEIVHLRASGNAPELRAYAEAATAGRAEALVRALLAAMGDMMDA